MKGIIGIVLGILLMQVKPDNGTFTIYQDGKKVGTEEFSLNRGRGGYVADGRTRVTVGSETYDLRSHMELDDQLRPTFYEYQRQGSSIRLTIRKGGVSDLEYTVAGKTSPQDIRFPEDGVIVDNNFFHHYLLLLSRAGRTSVTLPAVVPQSGALGQISVRSAGTGKYEIETDNLKLLAITDNDGRLLRITDPSGKVIVER